MTEFWVEDPNQARAGRYDWCENMALNIRDCVFLLSRIMRVNVCPILLHGDGKEPLVMAVSACKCPFVDDVQKRADLLNETS